VIFAPARLAILGVLAAAGVVALSATAWSGTARPWDGGLELWRWTVWLAGAGAVLGLLGLVGTARVRPAAASAGAALLVVAVAMWLRQWWLLDFPPGHPVAITVAVSDLPTHEPSGHPSGAGYAAVALLAIAAGLAVTGALRTVRPPDQSPAG